MKRILIPNMGARPENVPAAFSIAIRESKAFGCQAITIITSVKDKLDSTVGNFLGRDAAKRLTKGGTVVLGDTGVSLVHESVATSQRKRQTGIGLTFYVSKDAIQKLDELDFDCLIFVPWLDTEGIAWAQKWNAETIGGVTVGANVNLPQIVIDALRGLTARVNLSTGLGHPADKEHAKRTFSELRTARASWHPDEIEKWAVRNGWGAEHARELAAISGKYA